MATCTLTGAVTDTKSAAAPMSDQSTSVVVRHSGSRLKRAKGTASSAPTAEAPSARRPPRNERRVSTLFLHAREVRDERVDLVLWKIRVRLHGRLAIDFRFRRHLRRVGDPLPDVIGRQLRADAVEHRTFLVAFAADEVANGAFGIDELLPAARHGVLREGAAGTQRGNEHKERNSHHGG